MSLPLSADLQSNILKVLADGELSMAAPAVAKALPVGGRPRTGVLKTVLKQMTTEGLLARVPGRTDKYIATPIQGWARRALVQLLESGPQSEAKLKKVLPRKHEPLLGELLESLLAANRVFRHPSLKKGGKATYALHPADPILYIAKDVDKLVAAAMRKGFSASAVRVAVMRHLEEKPANADAGRKTGFDIPAEPAGIVQAMRHLEPRVEAGAAVSISRLRRCLGDRLDKETFDVAVLSLARQAVVELQSHAWPARLTVPEQRELIDNGRGGWFDSVALNLRTLS